MKKITFILTFILSFNTMAEDVWQCGENCTATLDENGILRVSGTGEMYSYDLQTRFHTPWLSSQDRIKTVIVEDGITKIGDDAFFGCNFIEKIELAKSVQYVGEDAFDENQRLQSVTMYDSTLWNTQGNLNDADWATPSINIYCYGDLQKCEQNFSHTSGMKSKLSLNYKGKRIYTIEEANRVAGDKNRVSIRYR